MTHDQQSSTRCLSVNQRCWVLFHTVQCSTLHPPELISTVSFALQHVYVLIISLHRSKSRHFWNKVLTTRCAEWLHWCPMAMPIPSCTPWPLGKVTLYQTHPENSSFAFKTMLQLIPPAPACCGQGQVCACPEIKLIAWCRECSLGGVRGLGRGVVCMRSRRRHERLL